MRHTIANVFLLGAALLVFLWIGGVYVSIKAAISSAAIDSWLVRAKDAGNPAQVAEFLTEYKTALHSSARDSGYSCVLRFPGCSVQRYVRVVDGLIQRSNDLALQSPTDTSYQMGLLNLEKDLGDIEKIAYGVWLADWGWLKSILAFFGWAGVLLLLIIGYGIRGE